MVPKWFENLLLILVFGLLGGFMGLAGPGFAWGAIIGLVILGLVILFEMVWAALMKWMGATFFTKKETP